MFGPVLMASAKASGFKCLIISSEKFATDQKSRNEHSVFRYRMLPDVLRVHKSVMVLDTDSIVRKPFKIEPWVDIGLIYRPGKHSKNKICGSAVYFSSRALPAAEWLRKRLSGTTEWYDDQLALLELFAGRKYRFQIFDETWVNWHMDDHAPIWTGKGPLKLTDEWFAEMQRWHPQAIRPVKGKE